MEKSELIDDVAVEMKRIDKEQAELEQKNKANIDKNGANIEGKDEDIQGGNK